LVAKINHSIAILIFPTHKFAFTGRSGPSPAPSSTSISTVRQRHVDRLTDHVQLLTPPSGEGHGHPVINRGGNMSWRKHRVSRNGTLFLL